jgi:hypothetical protein
MDRSWLIGFGVSPWQLIARGTLMYWFLFLVFRFLLRPDVGGLGIADVLLVVLVAVASQNAMTASYHSVGEGIVVVSTLIGWKLPTRRAVVPLSGGRAISSRHVRSRWCGMPGDPQEPASRIHHDGRTLEPPASERY